MEHQFKVGDRVRVNGDPHNQAYAREYGYKGTLIVDHIVGGDLVCFDKDGHRGMFSFRLEPAPALIDPAKKYRTRDGRDVRIYATDGGGDLPIHGAIQDSNGEWDAQAWTEAGKWLADDEDENDLIEVKPEREYWANIYDDGQGACLYETKAEANSGAGVTRVACLHLKFREGDGL